MVLFNPSINIYPSLYLQISIIIQPIENSKFYISVHLYPLMKYHSLSLPAFHVTRNSAPKHSNMLPDIKFLKPLLIVRRYFFGEGGIYTKFSKKELLLSINKGFKNLYLATCWNVLVQNF